MSEIKRPSEMIWVSYYRPKNLDDLLVPERIKEKLRNGIYNHLFFYGSQGTGKTSAAEILANQHVNKYINASLSTSVDGIRGEITEFANTLTLGEEGRELKVVVLDELDGVSDQFLKALRGTIESFASTTRFVATCNHFQNIPDAIKSRFECINFDWDDEEEQEVKKQFAKKVWNICEENGMEIEKEALKELVQRNFPDLRTMITTLQGYHSDGIQKITKEEVKRFHGAYKDVFDFIFENKDPLKNYKELGKYQNKVDDIINALGKDFIEYIEKEKPMAKDVIGDVCYEVNKHSYEKNFAIDPFVTLLSLVFKLQKIVQEK